MRARWAHDTDAYDVVFRGSQLAAVSVSGDGDTDLDCFVYDGDGNLVTKDDDATDECRLTFRPQRSMRYRVGDREPREPAQCVPLPHQLTRAASREVFDVHPVVSSHVWRRGSRRGDAPEHAGRAHALDRERAYARAKVALGRLRRP